MLFQGDKAMKLNSAILSTALVLVVILSHASAAPSKIYSAAICKPAAPIQAGNVDYPFGPYGIRNNNGYTVSIICPLMQETRPAGVNPPALSVSVTWTAKYSADRIVCAVKRVDYFGQVKAAYYAERFGTGWLQFNNITLPDTFGSWVVDCQLPPLGTVHIIRTDLDID
jgi:hypothetical protein